MAKTSSNNSGPRNQKMTMDKPSKQIEANMSQKEVGDRLRYTRTDTCCSIQFSTEST